MSTRSTETGGHRPHASGPRGAATRIASAWRAMHSDQRLAAAAALGLFVTMLLPWYTNTGIFVVKGTSVPRTANGSFSAFGAFSFVEAAVLLVCVFVLGVLFARAEDRAFHLPGGDGTVIMLAGAWAAILIFYRMLDKPGLHNSGVLYTEGITWGIFVALFVALALSYAGWRMRAAARPEPPLVLDENARRRGPPAPEPRPPRAAEPRPPRAAEPRDPASPYAADRADAGPEADVTRTREPRVDERPRHPAPPAGDDATRRPTRRAVTREDAAQLSFDDPPVGDPFADDPPVARRPR